MDECRNESYGKKHAHTNKMKVKKNAKLEESGKSDSPMANSK